MGMTVSKNTLCNWLKKGKKYLDELVCVLKSIALEKDSIVNCDETWCKVRKYDHYKKCYIWVLVNKAQKTAIFFYENGSRGRDVLTDFLGDAELKSIMSDGYNAYVFIGNELKSARFKYGSDAGAGMAATYHSMIGTVKLHGSSVWNFIGTFFKKIFNGCRDYVTWFLTKSLWLQANVNFKTN